MPDPQQGGVAAAGTGTTMAMFAPDGSTGEIPLANVKAAQAAGFKVAVQMQSPDGKAGYIPADRVHDAATNGFKMVPLDVPDAAKATYWDALTNPVASGGRAQGVVGGALQFGGQAIKTMAQPFLHPIDTLEGVGKVAADAVTAGPQAAAQDVVEPLVRQYLQDKKQGGNALALENLAGQVAGNVEGGRVMGAAVSGVKPSAMLGPAGEAPAPGAAGPVNTVGGVNRLVPRVVQNGALPSAWDWASGALKPAIAGDVNAPIAGTDITPASRYASMQRMGVQPNAAEATNSGPAKMAEMVNENSLTAAPTYARARAANLAALNRFANERLVAASPESVDAGLDTVQNNLQRLQSAAKASHDAQANRVLDLASPLGPEEGGAATQQGLQKAQASLQDDAQQGFSALDDFTEHRMLPGTTIQEAAKKIYDANSSYYEAHPSLVPGNAWKLVKDLAGEGNNFESRPMSFPEVQQLRSDVLELERTNTDIVKNQAGGWLKQLATAADQTMTTGATGLSPEGTQIFRDANEAWANMKGTYDNPSHPFYQAVRTQSPSTLLNGIQQTPEMAKMLRVTLGPDGIGPIQRAVAEKALGQTADGGYDFGNFQAKWNGIPEAYRKALFTPEQLSRLDDLASKTSVNPFHDPQSLLYKVANARDASTVLNLVKTPEAVRALGEALGPDGMGPIQRGVAEKLLGTTKDGGYNFKTFQGQWNKLPEAYRNALFTPEQQRQLEDIGNAGTVLNEDVNPSGSARLGQKMTEMGAAGASVAQPHLLPATGAYHAAQYALGRLMNSPTFVDWLMRDQGAPAAARTGAVSPLVPAAVASGAARIATPADPRTGPEGQPNFYSDAYLRSKAAFDAAGNAAQ